MSRPPLTGLKAALCVLVLGAFSTPATADWLYVSKDGLPHLEEIRKAIAPAPLFKAGEGAQGPWYVRAVIRDVVPTETPRQQAATYMSYEEFQKLLKSGAKFGRGIDPTTRLKFVAFGVEGRPRSSPVELPALWFAVVSEMDSLRDVRLGFGNFDEAFGVPAASRAYVERLFEVLDPDGSMGLKPARLIGSATSIPVDPGFATSQVTWMRTPADQRVPLIAAFNSRADARYARLGIMEPQWQLNAGWVTAIATARRYRLEPGFAEAAFGAVSSFLRLLTLEPGRFAPRSIPESPTDDLSGSAAGLVLDLLRAARVSPDQADPNYDGGRIYQAVQDASERLLWRVDAAPADVAAAVAADVGTAIEAGRAQPARPDDRLRPLPDGGRDPQLPVDPSEVAAIALEMLNSTDALCFAQAELIEQLVDTVLAYERAVVFPSPRATDRVRLRPQGLRLLVRLLAPSKSADARTAAACQATAAAARGYVLRAAASGGNNRGERLFAFDVLRASGWAPRPELEEFVSSLRDSTAYHYVQSRENPPDDPAQRNAHRIRLAQYEADLECDVIMLSAVLDLAASNQPDLRAAAASVQQWIQEVDAGRGDSGERYVLERLRAFRAGAGR